MKTLLLLCLLIFLPSCQFSPQEKDEKTISAVTSPSSVTYQVSQRLTLVNEGPLTPEKHNIWIALIGDHAPYQEIISRDVQPENYMVISDEYGNHYAEFDFKDLAPGTRKQISINYEITVKELAFNLDNCSGDLPQEFNQAELHIESGNPQIIDLANKLTLPGQTVCEQVRSFYDHIGQNLVYTYNGNDWGAQAALGKMGADCTEYSSLLIALSRSSGIPARYVEGLLFLDKSNSTLARQEHAWAEVFFPGLGWVPIDPTLGRSTLTREQHFARYSPKHIKVTQGRHPSTLRGASYWSHLYWPGDSTTIRIEDAGWTIKPIG
jgi:transglutaminase-like putative cysteine protease